MGRAGRDGPSGMEAAEVDALISGLADWRGARLDALRQVILGAAPDIGESVKWRKPSNDMRGVAVWDHAGQICTGEIYKAYVKLTFAQGAALPDPCGLFNAGLNGGTRRAIDLRETDSIDPAALQALIRAAIACNLQRRKPPRTARPG